MKCIIQVAHFTGVRKVPFVSDLCICPLGKYESEQTVAVKGGIWVICLRSNQTDRSPRQGEGNQAGVVATPLHQNG